MSFLRSSIDRPRHPSLRNTTEIDRFAHCDKLRRSQVARLSDSPLSIKRLIPLLDKFHFLLLLALSLAGFASLAIDFAGLVSLSLPKLLIRSNKFSSSCSTAALSSSERLCKSYQVSTHNTSSVLFGTRCLTFSASSTLSTSNPRPNLARNFFNRPASSSSIFSSF